MTALYFRVETRNCALAYKDPYTVLHTENSSIVPSVPLFSHSTAETLVSLLISKRDWHSPVPWAFHPPGVS